MKTVKSLKWLSLLLVLALGIPGSALAYTDRNLEAPRAENVVIDGDLSEWDLTRCLTIDSEAQIIDQIEHWDGVEDCSMEIYAMWDEENLYIGARVKDDTPFVYREGFPLDELDAIILFLSTNPEADPDRTAYEATDWRIVQSTDEYDFFNFVDRSMVADDQGYATQGEYGDELVFDDYEAATVRDKEYGGWILESKIPLHNLSNEQIPQLVPQAGMTIGFDFSVLDVDLPCPGIHSLRMQSSANLEGRDRTPADYDVDNNPSLWGTLTFVEE
ncbi:MAG TPA: hypothetical protein IAA66_02790 [Candidatus Avichristensenella intestinipullorum]|mgnify:CR=1 FL=1|uniref:Carbohydrate-binding domain-containing protein n=1 Tax=Candidatus Avichristensenella intestinipullorum TaxID=2840693 RepID=A0A9D0YV17_9FIRM|nr:hypothetical protein [Candidatus Avichristensenella intestinipullorum]